MKHILHVGEKVLLMDVDGDHKTTVVFTYKDIDTLNHIIKLLIEHPDYIEYKFDKDIVYTWKNGKYEPK